MSYQSTPIGNPRQTDLLISHRPSEADFALSLAARLEKEVHADGQAFKVWVYELDVAPGEGLVGAINRALENSRHVALLLTPDYFESDSGWADAEWQAALNEDPAGRHSRVIPAIVKDCPYIPPLLKSLNMLDLRGSAFERNYRRLVEFLRGRDSSALRGESVHRLAVVRGTAQTSLPSTKPDVTRERLKSNLLPVLSLPGELWAYPIKESLRNADTGSLPSKRELYAYLREITTSHGLRGVVPVIARVGDEVVTFHRSSTQDPILSIVQENSGHVVATAEWITDLDKRRVLTDLLNASVQSHLRKKGLVVDFEKHRFFFRPSRENQDRIFSWRKGAKPRTVTKALTDQDGALLRWRHSAAHVRFLWAGGAPLLHIRPTVLFTRDGTPESLIKGSVVGSMSMPWLGRERNDHLLYHAHFWAHVLGSGKTPIIVPASTQRIIIDPEPSFIELDYGVLGDQRNIEAQLETIEDPDETLDINEYPTEAEEENES